MRILGLIPARGGSKGIPNKNKKLLGGKPLLQYTVETAQHVSSLDRLIFSSEDSSLIELAKSMGVEVPFVRPATLSTDQAGSLEVVQHAVRQLASKGDQFDAVCLLQVTTPFRTSEAIEQAIQHFKDAETDSLISVQKVPHQYNPHWVFVNSDNQLKIATGESRIISRRQELPDAYIRDGAVYITKTNVLMEMDSFFGESISYVESNPDTFVNIDTMEDWQKAEQIVKTLNL